MNGIHENSEGVWVGYPDPNGGSETLNRGDWIDAVRDQECAKWGVTLLDCSREQHEEILQAIAQREYDLENVPTTPMLQLPETASDLALKLLGPEQYAMLQLEVNRRIADSVLAKDLAKKIRTDSFDGRRDVITI